MTRKQPLSSVEEEKEDSDEEGGCMNWLWTSKHTEAAPPAPDTNIGSEVLRPEAPKFVPQAWEQEEVSQSLQERQADPLHSSWNWNPRMISQLQGPLNLLNLWRKTHLPQVSLKT